MKKLIRGRRYGTDIAMEIGSYNYGNYGDLGHWSETLYRKRTGEFFIYGEGGPMSKYAKSLGQNEWSGSEDIIPVSTEAAQRWAEEYLDGDTVEKVFGVIDDDQSKKITSFSLSEATLEKIARLAAEKGISKSDVVERVFQKLDRV